MTRKEFDQYVDKIYYNLIKYSYRYTTDTELAEDIIQDTLLKLLENLDRLTDKNMIGLSLVAFKNNFINHFRKISYSVIDKVEYLENIETYMYDQIESDEVLNTIDTAKKYLTTKEQTLINLRILGYTYEEISDIVDHSIGTVKSQIFKAKHKLLKLLGNEIPGKFYRSN